MANEPPGSALYRGYALAMMTAVYMLNLVDRGLMMILLEPIKRDLDLTDTQLGFVTGIAFGLFYATLGLPLARIADRGNRVKIAALAIGFWGLTVMACVMVTSYIQLVLARVFAAAGEAGCKPPTYSLIGDYFPAPASRARAMSVYWVGNPLSTLLSFALGGYLAEHYGWRATFFIMGVPGLILALIVWTTIRETRTFAEKRPIADFGGPTTKEVCLYLWRHRATRHLSFALIILYLLGLGLGPWYATFLVRTHQFGTAELGIWLGVIFTSSGIVGILLGGLVAGGPLAGDEKRQLRICALTTACTVPGLVCFLLLPDRYASLLSLAPLLVIYSFSMAPTYAIMQRLVPDDMRASSLAVVMLLANLVGFGIGPQAVGILSDLLMPALGLQSLRYAMLALSFVGLLAAWQFIRASASVGRELSDAEIARKDCSGDSIRTLPAI